MRTEELLEQCLQALTTGQELPVEVARYLAQHPEQQAEVEDLLFIAQRVSRRPNVEIAEATRRRLDSRLADRLGINPAALRTPAPHEGLAPTQESGEMLPYSSTAGRKKLRLSMGRVALAKLRDYSAHPHRDPASEARVREVFRDLTPEDIRRYIGVRGEDYLYYRQRLPGWRPVLAFIAFVLRGFKRLEKLVTVSNQ
ncbi:MAG: hypothetical protein QOH93_953 [Chloroflexia bacterium]|jgi:hypothetical protein|nr:hypothetical protein [Chloroflexia bacterium]